MLKMRKVNDGLGDAVSEALGLTDFGPTRTQQSAKDETDINGIVKRFKVTGIPPRSGIRTPTYGDFNGIGDFRDAMDAINVAKRSFAELPSAVRKRFGNDPQLFLEFCSEEENFPEMRKLGLAVPEKEPEKEVIQKVEVVNPTTPVS